jgi:hypothetical protein
VIVTYHRNRHNLYTCKWVQTNAHTCTSSFTRQNQTFFVIPRTAAGSVSFPRYFVPSCANMHAQEMFASHTQVHANTRSVFTPSCPCVCACMLLVLRKSLHNANGKAVSRGEDISRKLETYSHVLVFAMACIAMASEFFLEPVSFPRQA